MTISSTGERLAYREEAERIRPEASVAAPAVRTDSPPSVTAPAEPPWTWLEVEEAEPPAAPTDWTTRFAWAKTMGGW